MIETIIPLLLRLPSSLSEVEVADLRREYQNIGRENLDTFLTNNKQMRPFAAEALVAVGCDTEYWNEVHQLYEYRNSKIFDILLKVFTDFGRAGGKTMCVYENFGAVLSSRESIGCFASGDVDLSVNPDEEQLAIYALKMNGFNLDKRNDHASVSDKLLFPFYNPDVLDGMGYWLNIMRKPMCRNFMLVQSKYDKHLSILRASETEKYNDTPVQILNPTPMVYYNALHFACEHHYSASPGMALCCDVDRIVRAREVDWVTLAKWSKEDEAGLRVKLALDVCNHFLKTPVPLEVFGKESANYKKLRSKIIDLQNNMLVPQVGKLARLRTELESDDRPMALSFITRLWRR